MISPAAALAAGEVFQDYADEASAEMAVIKRSGNISIRPVGMILNSA
jgi:hypothetical protein